MSKIIDEEMTGNANVTPVNGTSTSNVVTYPTIVRFRQTVRGIAKRYLKGSLVK